MSVSISRTFCGTGAAWAPLSGVPATTKDAAVTTVILLATLVPFSSAGPAVTRTRAPCMSAARTALRSYVNSWYWLSSVRTTRVFLVDETTAPATAASFVACEDALSFAACEVELFSWHWAGIAMKVETNRTEQTTIRARIFLLLLLTRLQGSDSRLGGCCIPIGGTAPRGGET